MPTLVGNKSTFAIESSITKVYEDRPFQALGYIVVFVGGNRYGICSPDAALLGGPYQFILERISRQGKHVASFATEPNAGAIADAFRNAVYAPGMEKELFFGMTQDSFCSMLNSAHARWDGDLDEGFDDGSYLLQFDIGEQVRLIAFQANKEGYHHNPQTLRDVWLKADAFYGVLKSWTVAFKSEWQLLKTKP